MSKDIPRCELAIIGGSSTFAINFPEDIPDIDTEVIDRDLIFTTPYGDSPPFKLFRLGGQPVLTCKMHGWRQGVNRADASRQIFWVFRAAGVKKILAEGGVGSINHLLKPRDILVPNDYIDQSLRKDVSLGEPYLLMMRQALCPVLRARLVEAAEADPPGRVFDRGVYVCTDGRHFESPAEVAAFSRWGADIIGQSICPEVYLARETGACYARVDLVVNYAEGVIRDWEHAELKDIFYSAGNTIGKILLNTFLSLDPAAACECGELRKPTLLKEK